MKRKNRYLKLTERDDRNPEIYDGYVTYEDAKEITLICQGPTPTSTIRTETFYKKNWIIKESSKEMIEGYFLDALRNQERKIKEMEFDLLDARSTESRQQRYFEQVFK